MNQSTNVKIFSLICLLLLPAIACSRFGLGSDVKTPEGKPPVWENSTDSDLSAEIAKAYKKLFASRSYQARIIETSSADNSDSGTCTVSIKFAAPNRFHTVQIGEGGILLPGEWILLGKNAYAKTPDSKWKKSSVEGKKTMDGKELPPDFNPYSQMVEESFDTDYNMSRDITVSGQDVVNGLPAKVYQFSYVFDGGGQKKNTKTKMWIGINDNLPYKTETDRELIVGSHVVKSKTTITFSDFDTDIKIEPPV